jgi:uncharacterized protein (UPF0335 family)
MDTKTSFAQGQLRSLIERIERLEEEKKAIAADIKEVYAEAKSNGFDVKVIRKVVSLRKKDQAERAEEEAMLDLYLAALGMIVSEGSLAEARGGADGSAVAE